MYNIYTYTDIDKTYQGMSNMSAVETHLAYCATVDIVYNIYIYIHINIYIYMYTQDDTHAHMLQHT